MSSLLATKSGNCSLIVVWRILSFSLKSVGIFASSSGCMESWEEDLIELASGSPRPVGLRTLGLVVSSNVGTVILG